MAGMRALGRVYDVVTGDAAGNTLKVSMKNCSGVGILAVCGDTESSTLTIKAAEAYGDTYYAAGVTTFPSVYYSRDTSVGTGAWTLASSGFSTVASTGVVTCAGATATYSYYTDFLCSYLADQYDYLEVIASAGFQVTLIMYDLTVQRTPANLVIPAA